MIFLRLQLIGWLICLWTSVILVGALLRFENLADRPFHADEATGARITAKRMEPGGATFDPKHFHGPLLADLAIPLCKSRGESCWRDLTKSTMRLLPAIAGTLLVMLPLCWRRRFGDGPMLLAAALLATSPLLVYYSRMFIHEMLLALFGLAALMALTRNPHRGRDLTVAGAAGFRTVLCRNLRWAIPGILIGLMFATKESFAISIIAWSAAAALVLLENHKFFDRKTIVSGWHQYRLPVAIALAAAAITAGGFYTDGFRHPQGAIDAVRTFFVYETVVGHDKPADYYLRFLALPQKAAGVWWYGTPVVVLALFSYLSTFRRSPQAVRGRAMIRFITYAAAGHFLIYGLIAYKTPWLACLPWAHVCLLAGFSLTEASPRRILLQTALVMLAGACLVTQFQQTRRAIADRYASDDRNPFAYVPTRPDIEKAAKWLDQLRQVAPGRTLEPIYVIGGDYWPLPWYLRSFGKIGYWPNPPTDMAQQPLVIAMPDAEDEVMRALENSHMFLPRGLRANVQIDLFVRNDIWELWKAKPK